LSARIEASLSIAVDHPAFIGHFPAAPVVPGVVLLDEAMVAIGALTGVPHNRIAWVKFLRPVLPGEPLLVQFSVAAGAAVDFEIVTGPHKVASGRLLPISAP
jgi:3-hydroxymyristoyl/3-hydroxydecanoyl-(acyl carrier protein) dehydratase